MNFAKTEACVITVCGYLKLKDYSVLLTLTGYLLCTHFKSICIDFYKAHKTRLFF